MLLPVTMPVTEQPETSISVMFKYVYTFSSCMFLTMLYVRMYVALTKELFTHGNYCNSGTESWNNMLSHNMCK